MYDFEEQGLVGRAEAAGHSRQVLSDVPRPTGIAVGRR